MIRSTATPHATGGTAVYFRPGKAVVQIGARASKGLVRGRVLTFTWCEYTTSSGVLLMLRVIVRLDAFGVVVIMYLLEKNSSSIAASLLVHCACHESKGIQYYLIFSLSTFVALFSTSPSRSLSPFPQKRMPSFIKDITCRGLRRVNI